LEERFTHGVLGCFLGVRDRDNLEKMFLADEAARNRFVLFWEAMAGLEMKAFSCFQE